MVYILSLGKRMNTQTIRIKPESKKEIDRLMVEKMTIDHNLNLTHSDFMDVLILSYKEHEICRRGLKGKTPPRA